MKALKLLLAIAFLTGATAQADIIEFKLSSHPDGSENPPPYGLRLDGLYGTNGSDVWGFDFDHASSDVRLYLDTDNNTVNISGNAYGGMHDGNVYDSNLQGVWSIDFTYSANLNIDLSGNPPYIEVESLVEAPASNNGTLTALFSASGSGVDITNGDVIALEQEMGFFFNNTEDHRLGGTGLSGPETYVGWGWLNHSGEPHVEASDWLFTATVVPVPAAVWLFGSALAGLGWMRRRK